MTGKRESYGAGRAGRAGVYRPGSVLKYTCQVQLCGVEAKYVLTFLSPQPGSVVVPVVSATRVCRKGRWDGQPGQCVKKTPRFQVCTVISV